MKVTVPIIYFFLKLKKRRQTYDLQENIADLQPYSKKFLSKVPLIRWHGKRGQSLWGQSSEIQRRSGIVVLKSSDLQIVSMREVFFWKFQLHSSIQSCFIAVENFWFSENFWFANFFDFKRLLHSDSFCC